MTKVKLCPFCGGEFHIYTETPCGNHPNETWYIVNHYCAVDIEILQKGGNYSDIVKILNTRYEK